MDERMIFLMRHAQTQMSSGKRLIGQCDVSLSDIGFETCHRIGEALKTYRIDCVCSSQLKRARQTADIMASYLDKQVIVAEGINEISLGDWDGRFVADLQKEYPKEYEQRGKDLIHYRVPGGENYIDMQKRVLNAFSELCKQQGNLLIVAHTSVNRIILADILGMPLSHMLRISQDYGCLNVIAQRGLEPYVKTINLGSH